MFDEIDKLLIREIQGNIPLSLDPYGDIAKKIGCSREEVLKRLENYSRMNILKRIGAILNHRDSGFTENGMFTAVVPVELIKNAGRKLTSIPNVTHCYERKCYPEWPYNFYAMIHGKTKDEVETVVNNFVHEMDIKDYQILYSTEEFKKTSMKYF
jgi:DNA-binding Lrp family transcriptional regulator